MVFDAGRLYAHFQGLQDTRKPEEVQYPQALVLLIVLAKICGEDHPGGLPNEPSIARRCWWNG
ncbi:MAG TPA: hypothetical protein DEQ80_00900 [Anaerolinea thermolimosa]|uniref:Uncharacterized protein n=1 Tax=Anaerolinea thermolimosa TaxID=229919 RepID=A0A3D1JD24_9CHLR|nr:hypothetical protein ATHL_02634 [Anaerolinea thermolimosa]HCE16393.1 hypothetical protein [Anaerolinea thermolimosa]